MSTPIAMPQLGLTMTEGTVSAWLKKIGDVVKKDEIILVVSTDKVDMDIESPADGILTDIIVDVGQTVPVGTPLAHLDGSGENTAGTASSQAATATYAVEVIPEYKQERITDVERIDATPTERAAIEQVKQERTGSVVASPRAKRIAKELGIDLTTVKGSGPSGRIVEEDVRCAAPDRPVQQKNTNRRQLIAERMVESITTIPAFSVSLEVNAESLVALYENLKRPITEAAGTKLTYTDLILKALAVSLAKTPEMNTLWDSGVMRQLSAIGLGLAVATDRGVVAPTLIGVNDLSLEKLARRRAKMTEKARQSRLAFSDIEGAAGTLSNLGMYRIDSFKGIITPGQTFILAVGKLQNRPWVETTLVVKPTLVLNLSVDHRVVDGAAAAAFLERVAEVIESPYRILWNAEKG